MLQYSAFARDSAHAASLIVGCLLLPAAAFPQEETGTGITVRLTAETFHETARTSGHTSAPMRLLLALGVVAGLVGLAFLAAWFVTRLGDRGPAGGPAPLVDLPANRRRKG